MYKRNCPSCGKELSYKQKCQVTYANKHNSKCGTCASTRVGLNTKCHECKKMFYRRPSDMRKLNFCTQKCSAQYYTGKFQGENSPLWSGGPVESQKREIQKQREKRVELKTKGVEFLGGKCKNCGYDKCIASLDFHHINPLEKDKNFLRKCDMTWDIMKEKIKNCILLCANCHREYHYLRGGNHVV